VLVAHRFVVRGGNTFSVDPEYSRGERVTARVKVRPRARRTEAEDV
jgi:heat shock protein HspQ